MTTQLITYTEMAMSVYCYINTKLDLGCWTVLSPTLYYQLAASVLPPGV